jgi:hypothetical protein
MESLAPPYSLLKISGLEVQEVTGTSNSAYVTLALSFTEPRICEVMRRQSASSSNAGSQLAAALRTAESGRGGCITAVEQSVR